MRDLDQPSTEQQKNVLQQLLRLFGEAIVVELAAQIGLLFDRYDVEFSSLKQTTEDTVVDSNRSRQGVEATVSCKRHSARRAEMLLGIKRVGTDDKEPSKILSFNGTCCSNCGQHVKGSDLQLLVLIMQMDVPHWPCSSGCLTSTPSLNGGLYLIHIGLLCHRQHLQTS